MNENIENVLAILDEFRTSDEITYSAYSALYDEISLLDDLLKKQEPVVSPTIGDWISVKNRMPDKCGRYLCWFGGNKCVVGAEIETYLPDMHGFGSLERNEVYPNISHWMPLPEPPKEEENNA